MAAPVHGGLGWVRVLLTSLDAVGVVGHVIAAILVARGAAVCSPHGAKRTAGRSTLRFAGATVDVDRSVNSRSNAASCGFNVASWRCNSGTAGTGRVEQGVWPTFA